MLNRPTFKRFSSCVDTNDSVFILSEKSSVELANPLYQKISKLIDGVNTVDDIVEKIIPSLLPQEPNLQDFIAAGVEVFSALVRMEREGYIVESNDSLASNLAAYCDTLNVDYTDAYSRLQTTRVAIKSCGYVGTSEFITMLESLGIQVSCEGDIEVVLTDDYLADGLDVYNQNALKKQRPWILVKPVGTVVWIGPIFYPKKTGCWECLAQRLRGNRPVEEFIQRRQGISRTLSIPLPTLPSAIQTGLGMAATEIFKWIVRGENKRLEGIIVTYDTVSLQIQNHILVKRPQCPVCGELKNGLNPQILPVVLGHRRKVFTADGGHRCFAPEETLRRYQYHISTITGVVREIVKISSSSTDLIHIYAAKHHFASTFDDLLSLRQNLTGRSAGKGRTDSQAKASAFGEAIERYSGVFQGDEIQYRSSYHSMGEKAIHPNSCMNFSQEQYNNREEWNEICPSFFQKVPEPFDEEREINWTPVWSLTHQDFKYLPTAYCYHGYPQPAQPDCWADTNGSAAGNTIEEAILQGFLELVERDAVALWWYNRVKRPLVDLDSFDEPYFQALKDYYQSLNREIWVIDITSDLNIPAFAAVTRRIDRDVEDIVLGYGAHLDPQLAIQRALTEVNQLLPAVLSANADGSTHYLSYEALALKWWQTATIQNQPYLVPDATLSPRVRADYTRLCSDDLLDDIMTCQKIVEKHGMEMLVLDQSRLDIGLKVVKVIVPGMRHFWRRLGAGRLYEVPLQLGWVNERQSENELNPFPMWM
ncbi:TOMM precursor leader peptide-binding protein [[Phormidium] sp. ETS-05]|uniref:TOMM precursor leader peptide-binding protein n=1 Tax=[Phormidium] sp. ETS-05 TaxID=222819 RepID=UPI0018EF1524|nr:TOMM precursor leader peptide-binding protein [[Phormidium] sp. ETS-05]